MKVLIISHNAISTTNNMGKTLLSLFSEFNKEELCQIFVHPMMPDVDVCSSYYCITDEAVLKSLITMKKPGHILDKSCVFGQTGEVVSVSNNTPNYAGKNKADPVKRLLRDLMWKLANWDNSNLKSWLEKEQPTCIFLAPGYAKFIYDIALVISEKLNIPIITYICDDYYFVKTPVGIVGKFQLSLLQKKMRKLFGRTTYLVAINEKIKKIYSDEFNVKSSVIMTGSNYHSFGKNKMEKEPVELSYFGNIGCNRSVSLAEIGRELDNINEKRGTNFSLKIYCDENNSDILSEFDGINSVRMCGFVAGEAFRNAFITSNILLHVEGFDEYSIDLVKYSISTKIADSLSVGIPLIAYGPENIASIEYLKKNNCAYIITKREELYECLNEILLEKEKLNGIVEKALETASINHDAIKNSKQLRQICESKSIKLLNLKQIKECEKQLLLHFKEFCNEKEIQFYLSNGTLLGAVKYQGFIPWDDDIDVLVPRKDYDRLVKSYQDNEKYKLFAFEKNEKYKYPYAKLCDMTTRKVEKNINNGVELGLDIDIFPLDKWPMNEAEANKSVQKVLKHIKILNFAKLRLNKGKTVIRTCIKIILILFAKMIGTNKLIHKMQVLALKNSNLEYPNYLGCVIWPIYGKREIIPKEVFEDVIEVEFEGEKYPAPIGYDEYLRSLYGDYEKDLPIEKQKTHHGFKAYRIVN